MSLGPNLCRNPNEQYERSVAKLAFAKELAELYPEALREQGGRWFSRELAPAQCDVVELVPSRDVGILVLTGKRLASGGVVYSRTDITRAVTSFPKGDVLEALLAFARNGGQRG